MLIVVVLIVEVNWKKNHAPCSVISLNKANLIERYYPFLKKYVAVAFHTYC